MNVLLGLQSPFSFPNIVVNFLSFCSSWSWLLHLTSPSVRQSFSNPSIGMPRRKFFGPRTTLTNGGFFSGTGHSCLSLLLRLHRSSRRARSLGRWMVAPRLSSVAFTCASLSHFFSSFFSCLLNLLSNTSMRNRYILFELTAKDTLRFHSLPAYLQSDMDNFSEVFMYSAEHVSSFGSPHLRVGLSTLIVDQASHPLERRPFLLPSPALLWLKRLQRRRRLPSLLKW